MNTEQGFKEKHSPQERLEKFRGFQQKYPNFVIVIVEKYRICKLLSLKKKIFLIQKSICFTQFQQQLRHSLQISQNDALFIFCGRIIVNEGKNFEVLYHRFKDKGDNCVFSIFRYQSLWLMIYKIYFILTIKIIHQKVNEDHSNSNHTTILFKKYMMLQQLI